MRWEKAFFYKRFTGNPGDFLGKGWWNITCTSRWEKGFVISIIKTIKNKTLLNVLVHRCGGRGVSVQKGVGGALIWFKQ